MVLGNYHREEAENQMDFYEGQSVIQRTELERRTLHSVTVTVTITSSCRLDCKMANKT